MTGDPWLWGQQQRGVAGGGQEVAREGGPGRCWVAQGQQRWGEDSQVGKLLQDPQMATGAPQAWRGHGAEACRQQETENATTVTGSSTAELGSCQGVQAAPWDALAGPFSLGLSTLRVGAPSSLPATATGCCCGTSNGRVPACLSPTVPCTHKKTGTHCSPPPCNPVPWLQAASPACTRCIPCPCRQQRAGCWAFVMPTSLAGLTLTGPSGGRPLLQHVGVPGTPVPDQRLCQHPLAQQHAWHQLGG